MTAKYDKIGKGYNLTRNADPYITAQILNHLQPESEGLYLDIGCGTGNYTSALQKKGLRCIGIDPSAKMLEIAKENNRLIDWCVGSAEKTGLSDDSIDGVIGSLTIHHWTDLNKGFFEVKRILKAKGRVVIFTSTPKQMKGYWLNYYFPKMMTNSIVQMPSLSKIENAMSQNGIEIIKLDNYSIAPDLEDHFLYCGKQNPEIYFDDQIRKGISSFSSLANQKEVIEGLTRLRKDIDDGKILEIIKSFENDLGDYLFVVGEKLHRTPG